MGSLLMLKPYILQPFCCKSILKWQNEEILQKRVANPKSTFAKVKEWRRNGRELPATSLLSWAVRRMLKESWVVGSSFHAGLPPSPTVAPFLEAMTMEWCHSTRIWKCDSCGFSIYKYRIPLLRNCISHSRFSSSSSPYHSPCTLHLPLFPSSLLFFYFKL